MKVAIDDDKHHGVEIEFVLSDAYSLAAKVDLIANDKQVDQGYC